MAGDLGFKMDLKGFKFEVLSYQKDLAAFMEKEIKRTGQVWLQIAVNGIPLPTWSGATRASFQKLAHALGTSVAIGPRATSNRKDRTALGKATSTGKIIIAPKEDFYGFEWSSSLRYLSYNEFNRAVVGPAPPNPWWKDIENTPYHFQARALAAWKDAALSVRLPDPLRDKYLKRIRIS